MKKNERNEDIQKKGLQETKENLNDSNKSNSQSLDIIKNSKNEQNSAENKYYIPKCRYKGCDGVMKITISEDKLLISGTCQKNKEHSFSNLFFEIFEKFYLKENYIEYCFKCHLNLETKNKYECRKCGKIYCSKCFISEEHIKKDLKNLKLITNKCPKDENILVYFCSKCSEKVCSICIRQEDENNPHVYHDIIDILGSMPSNNQLEELKEKILKKSDAFDSLIKSLEEWQNELNNRLERIKRNLKNEIKILKKLFWNFNINYMDYTYFSNFNKVFDNLEIYNNEYLKQFMKTCDFIKKTKHI